MICGTAMRSGSWPHALLPSLRSPSDGRLMGQPDLGQTIIFIGTWLVLVMVAGLSMRIIGLLAAIALPSYQAYVARSQAARVMGEAASLRAQVEICLTEGRTAGGGGACAVGHHGVVH